MENIIIVSFDIESEGYQAITELKKNVLKDGYAVSQRAGGRRARCTAA